MVCSMFQSFGMLISSLNSNVFPFMERADLHEITMWPNFDVDFA
jgi:hypothetical protein